MAKYEIIVSPERCTGCLLCQLACSYLYTRSFNPSAGRIMVDVSGVDCRICFTDECNGCGVCVDHCLYNALQKRPIDPEPEGEGTREAAR